MLGVQKLLLFLNLSPTEWDSATILDVPAKISQIYAIARTLTSTIIVTYFCG